MCSGCHLAPGMKRTEISRGLYPRAPELRRKTDLTPAELFWIVKHGVKMTGMPAWGVTHEDELLWDVVAFVRKLPELTPDQYETLVKNAPKHEELMQEMEMGGEHEHNGDHLSFSAACGTKPTNQWRQVTPHSYPTFHNRCKPKIVSEADQNAPEQPVGWLRLQAVQVVDDR
jgi:hypothetical protein